ncbi:hypothetical protein GCM10010399_48000 [Dactylosporangium fulvum]|uniref:RHS repeat-associated core domain-containing protein n=1 Tax=Dactylosporangium fulvum TaxID=53359 RepID=A0ABY5VTK8_9ACTN|nr:RHS repeat-associated core domain-containing protein [Dactylosporangium fulvum]UWP80451.1 hypothetical protein Dfulv_35565 [Dactylosporangium fulvum]
MRTSECVTLRRRTTPFGEIRGAVPVAWPSQRGFLNATHDDTGMVHLGARECDAAIGRFVSGDPIVDLTDPQQMNGYDYANNNPLAFSDPSGTRHEDVGDRRGGDNSPLHSFVLAIMSYFLFLSAMGFGFKGEVTTDLGDGGKKRTPSRGHTRKTTTSRRVSGVTASPASSTGAPRARTSPTSGRSSPAPRPARPKAMRS